MEALSKVIVMCLFILNKSAARVVGTSSTENSLNVNDTSDPPYCSRSGISCYDSYTIQHCNSIGTSGLRFTVSCKVQNPDTPYCLEYQNRVQCTPVDIVTQLKPSAPEVCNKQGLRPDPRNCRRYVQCEKKQNGTGFFGSLVNCPKGITYDIGAFKCRDPSTRYMKCDTIQEYCSENKGKLIAFPPERSIYVKCPDENLKDEFIVNICDVGSTFYESIGSCHKICEREGNMPNYENCKAYYTCFSDNQIALNICPTGTGYNRQTRLCDESLANCTN